MIDCLRTRLAGRPNRCPEPPTGDQVLCRTCEVQAGVEVMRLADDWFELQPLLAETDTGATEVRIARAAPSSRPPLNLAIDAVLRDISWSLAVWEVPVREAADLAPVREDVAARDGFVVQRAVHVLAPRVQLLAGLPPLWCYADGADVPAVEMDGAQGLERLLRLHRIATTALGVTRPVFRMPGACSSCGKWALRRAAGSDTVYCHCCDQRWTYTDYQRYVGMVVAQAERGTGA